VTIEADAARTPWLSFSGTTVVLRCFKADALHLAVHGPFDLLYCDAGPGKIDHQEVTIAMTRPGGLILLDDLTPLRPDLDWLNSSDVLATTIWITPALGAILAVRR
jgi:hypothetical protein